MLLYGDCLKEMDKLIEQGVTVDAIIADPPYGKTSCKWDAIIPLPEMWERLNKLIKLNGAIILFGGDPFASTLRVSNLKNYRYDWIWDKVIGTGFLNANKMPLVGFESMSVFYKKLPTYNPQKTEGKPFKDKRDNLFGEREEKEIYGTKPKPKKQENTGDRHPRRIIEISARNNKPLHPTQKPLKLMEYLVKTYTNEGEKILDFCMGSGTTCLAAQRLNRGFIGIENSYNYYKIASIRLNNS